MGGAVPELPEVETVVRDLRGPLVGRRFRKVTCGQNALRTGSLDDVRRGSLGKRVGAVERRGKWIVIDLEGPVLLVHLGMTGQLTFTPARTPRQNHTHIVWSLDGGSDELRFRDIRRFGSSSRRAVWGPSLSTWIPNRGAVHSPARRAV
jgi:formamidopyrimidine-DNA glycosylase